MEKMKRLATGMLAAVMVVSFAACKKSSGNNTSSDDIEYITEYEYQTADGTATSGGSSNSANSSKGGSSGSKGQSASVDVDKYKGTTVRYATWKDPALNEDGPVIEDFKKKTGIDVKIDLIGQGDYNNTIAGMVAAGNSPDVYFCNMFFPSCLSTLQPIDAAQLDLSDPIWDQSLLDYFTINDKTYLVGTMGNIWKESGCVYFNKTVLKQAGFTEGQFPDKLYEKGVWTWDALETIMSTVKSKLGSQGYLGAYLNFDTMLCSTGSNFYNYKNGQFTANSSGDFVTQVVERMADWYTKGYIHGFDTNCRDEFLNSKVAIAATDAFGLKRTGYWAKMNQDSIGFTYLPDYDSNHKAVETGLLRGWGIIKGASNPVGAGIFLRYYLDSTNYDTTSSFMNDAASKFFFDLTSQKSTNMNFTLSWNNYTTAMQQPSQVKGMLDSLQNSITEECNGYNDFIAKNTK